MIQPGIEFPRPRRLLVVEDDRDFAESLVELLEPHGYSVHLAFGIVDAIESLSSFSADIALVDVKLGGDDGVSLIPRLKGRRPELVCLLMTAYASLDSAMEAVRSGAHDYLSKPIEPPLLARKLEQAWEQSDLQKRREREQRLVSMGNLCAGVAHDVNNYLQVMVAELSTLGAAVRSQLPSEANALTSLAALEHATNGAASVCRQILAFARGSTSGAGSDASEVVQRAEPMLKKLLPARVSLGVVVPQSPLRVVFDAKQLEQILLNLLLNARHALADQGSVRIELCAHPELAVARLLVQDDGCGIPEAVLPRIFEPYFSTKPLSKGTGLGLSVVYGMVTAVGGSIRVESRVGEGTSFELLLPLKASDIEGLAHPFVAEPGARALRLLIVDDFPPILKSMEKLFKGRGYEVVCATSAEGAISLLDGGGPAFDGMISDVRLPGMSGVALADEVRRRKLPMPVILISGDTGHVPGSERFGPDFVVLKKPFRLMELVEQFESLSAAARARAPKDTAPTN